MNALVIDDSSAMRIILRRILSDCGVEKIVEAGDGSEALRRLDESGPIDLALVDWNMPVMDGLEFVKAVRANEEYAGLRVMMVSTENDAERVIAALEAGADEFIMKPFTKDVVVEKLGLLGLAGGTA